MATGPGRRVHPLWEACAVRQGSGGIQPGGGGGAAVPRGRVRTSGTASCAVTLLNLTGSVAFGAADPVESPLLFQQTQLRFDVYKSSLSSF